MGVAASSESLFSSGVLVEEGERISLSSDFESSVEDYRATVPGRSREALSRVVRERVETDRLVEPFADLGATDPRAFGEFCALHDRLEPSDEDEWVPLLPVLRLFRSESPPTHGTPRPFVPVTADLLPHLARIHPRLLVYVWLDDCPPCDELRTELESVFGRPREVMTFAVYGPDDKEVLAREYDVTAGPALLFMRDGSIDTRLYGSYEHEVIETELRQLQR